MALTYTEKYLIWNIEIGGLLPKKTIVMEQIDNEEQSNSYEPAKPNKYFAFVIVCTVVLCCLPLGIVGIVKTN